MGISEPGRPRVFLSYSRAPEPHRLLVRDFWTFLCAHGIDARMDLDGDEQPRNIPAWIRAEIAAADQVLCIASPIYRECFEDDGPRTTGRGVQTEGKLITEALFSGGSEARRTFLPVVLPGCTVDDVPGLFAPATHSYYRVTEFSEVGARTLLHYLRGARPATSTSVELVVRSEPEVVGSLLTALRELPRPVPVEPRVGMVTGLVQGPDVDVAERIGGVLRRLRETADQLGVEVRVGLCRDDDPASALELAEADALGALLTLRGARCAVAVTAGVRELLTEIPGTYPAGSSFRRLEDAACWVAVLGRSVCPPPPAAPLRDEPTGPPQHVSVSGTNNGIVATAGRDVVLGTVDHRIGR